MATSLLFGKRPSRHKLDATKVRDSQSGDETYTTQSFLGDPNVVAALVDNLAVSLHTPTDEGSTVEPIRIYEEEGRAVLRRSLAFLLEMAVARELPGHPALLVHDEAHTAYFFTLSGLDSVPQALADRIQRRMQAIVHADLPIREEYVRHVDAAKQLAPYASKLVRSLANARVLCCRCDGHTALRHRALAPSTGRLAGFSLATFREGVLLTFPPGVLKDAASNCAAGAAEPTDPDAALAAAAASALDESDVEPALELMHRRRSFAYSDVIAHDPVMFKLYREYKTWGATLGVECVGDINDQLVAGQGKELVLLCEALQDQKILSICSEIKSRVANGVRAVLISGPSTSGKTTLANKLRIQLKVMGLKPFTLGTDDYYRPHSDPEYPRDAKGALDFEDVNALQLGLLDDHLQRLFRGEEVETPVFDFTTGAAKPKGRRLKLPDGGVLIMEGIFCLQPAFASGIPRESKYLIYIAPMTTLALDDINFISNQPLRLIRRISRDHLTRDRGALQTIARWPSVKAGEERNIFPFVGRADAVFNSALDYELAVLKGFSRPLLATIKPDSRAYAVAQDLVALLDAFHELGAADVPSTSLLREFIGGSTFSDE